MAAVAPTYLSSNVLGFVLIIVCFHAQLQLLQESVLGVLVYVV